MVHCLHPLRCQRLLYVLRPQLLDAVDFAFTANDYLDVVRSFVILDDVDTTASGSTGFRLLSCHSLLVERVEQVAVTFHRADTALLFAIGYAANLGFVACLHGAADAVIYD